MFYIDQLRTPSLPIGFVKIESSLIVRSFETGLGSWTLVVAVISVRAYPFWLSQTWPGTLTIREYVFFGCTVLPDSKETELESSNQKASPLAGKNTGFAHGIESYSYFRWCGYFWRPWVSFVTADEFSVRITKINSRIGVSWTHSLPFYFKPIQT